MKGPPKPSISNPAPGCPIGLRSNRQLALPGLGYPWVRATVDEEVLCFPLGAVKAWGTFTQDEGTGKRTLSVNTDHM
jgi:hypothetical protein